MNLKTNPELLPLIEWWEKDGKQQTVIGLLVAAVAVGGWGGWHWWENHRIAVKNAASESIVNAYTTEEIEDAVSKFGSSDTGCALKIRLAKSYFDAGRYEEALGQYEALAGKTGAEFADIPVVGKAQCLEALGKFDEAVKAFDAFANDESKTNSFLKLTAQLGAARSVCEAGDKKKALERIEALKKAVEDDEIAKARVEATEAVIKRYGQKAAPAPAPKAEAPKAEAKLATTNAVKKVESK